jgi:NitT/TauT family transport system permease protein
MGQTDGVDLVSLRFALARWIAIRVLIVLALIVAWRGLIWLYAIPPYLVPRPLAVAYAAAAGDKSLLAHAAYTLGTAMLGLAISGIFAVILALACTNSPDLSRASMPLVIAFRSAPVTAIAPLIMLAVGRGMGTSIIVVTIVSFFPIFVNLMRGLAAPDPMAVELLAVTGASRWHQMRYLRLPAAMPFLFTGLRIAGGSAILGAMLSEWLTGAPGLGMLILESSQMRQVEMLWAAVILSILIALCVFWATSAGEKAVLSWRS